MPRSKAAVNGLGAIDAHGTDFRAHIQFRNDSGELKHIHGPGRGSEGEAQKDLDSFAQLEVSEQHAKKVSKSWWPKPVAFKSTLISKHR